MELIVLFAILALLVFGPRRGGRMPSRAAMIAGGLLLGWLALAFGFGWVWRALVGDVAQP